MNILVPDSWLREYLKTKATPKQLKEYLSLCGPSIERINTVDGETVYDVEITTNRPDSMSVVGMAREAVAILPRFGIKATLEGDPYAIDVTSLRKKYDKELEDKLHIVSDPTLNPRFTAVVIRGVTIKPSPAWLQKKLTHTAIRPINNVVDITNYLMRAYGQPAHAFDYDEIKKKHGVPTMIVRASKKGEKVETLDGKEHLLKGNDIVIEDGEGRIIDLCGIMGAKNSSIKDNTTSIVLFMQTYNPLNIRRTSMSLAHRTEAAALFEKGLDSELVLPTVLTGASLVEELTGGTISSKLYDMYPKPYTPIRVSVRKEKLHAYMGVRLPDKELAHILSSLGLPCAISSETISVTVPSWRQDITIDVDIIEEVARIYGYQSIETHLPSQEPPVVVANPTLQAEEDVKVRLRDLGYTEVYNYSMISEELMDVFALDKKNAYKIANPLSEEWVYMRPSLWPSMLTTVRDNLKHQDNVKLFELSMAYVYEQGKLPKETPVLIVAWSGSKFLEAKGLAEFIFSLYGQQLPDQPKPSQVQNLHDWDDKKRLLLGTIGSVSEVNPSLLKRMGIQKPVTIFWIHFEDLVQKAKRATMYAPIPKFPPIVEDLSFSVADEFMVGPLLQTLQEADPLVHRVTLLDAHASTRTVHVEYLDTKKNLTAGDIRPVREKLIDIAKNVFGADLRTA